MLVSGFTTCLASARAAGALGPDGAMRRRLILEFHLAALNDPTNGALVTAADAANYAARSGIVLPLS